LGLGGMRRIARGMSRDGGANVRPYAYLIRYWCLSHSGGHVCVPAAWHPCLYDGCLNPPWFLGYCKDHRMACGRIDLNRPTSFCTSFPCDEHAEETVYPYCPDRILYDCIVMSDVPSTAQRLAMQLAVKHYDIVSHEGVDVIVPASYRGASRLSSFDEDPEAPPPLALNRVYGSFSEDRLVDWPLKAYLVYPKSVLKVGKPFFQDPFFVVVPDEEFPSFGSEILSVLFRPAVKVPDAPRVGGPYDSRLDNVVEVLNEFRSGDDDHFANYSCLETPRGGFVVSTRVLTMTRSYKFLCTIGYAHCLLGYEMDNGFRCVDLVADFVLHS